MTWNLFWGTFIFPLGISVFSKSIYPIAPFWILNSTNRKENWYFVKWTHSCRVGKVVLQDHWDNLRHRWNGLVWLHKIISLKSLCLGPRSPNCVTHVPGEAGGRMVSGSQRQAEDHMTPTAFGSICRGE